MFQCLRDDSLDVVRGVLQAENKKQLESTVSFTATIRPQKLTKAAVTPLGMVCVFLDQEKVKLLLSLGANVNGRPAHSSKALTPLAAVLELGLCSSSGFARCVPVLKLLLMHGAPLPDVPPLVTCGDATCVPVDVIQSQQSANVGPKLIDILKGCTLDQIRAVLEANEKERLEEAVSPCSSFFDGLSLPVSLKSSQLTPLGVVSLVCHDEEKVKLLLSLGANVNGRPSLRPSSVAVPLTPLSAVLEKVLFDPESIALYVPVLKLLLGGTTGAVQKVVRCQRAPFVFLTSQACDTLSSVEAKQRVQLHLLESECFAHITSHTVVDARLARQTCNSREMVGEILLVSHQQSANSAQHACKAVRDSEAHSRQKLVELESDSWASLLAQEVDHREATDVALGNIVLLMRRGNAHVVKLQAHDPLDTFNDVRNRSRAVRAAGVAAEQKSATLLTAENEVTQLESGLALSRASVEECDEIAERDNTRHYLDRCLKTTCDKVLASIKELLTPPNVKVDPTTQEAEAPDFFSEWEWELQGKHAEYITKLQSAIDNFRASMLGFLDADVVSADSPDDGAANGGGAPTDDGSEGVPPSLAPRPPEGPPTAASSSFKGRAASSKSIAYNADVGCLRNTLEDAVAKFSVETLRHEAAQSCPYEKLKAAEKSVDDAGADLSCRMTNLAKRVAIVSAQFDADVAPALKLSPNTDGAQKVALSLIDTFRDVSQLRIQLKQLQESVKSLNPKNRLLRIIKTTPENHNQEVDRVKALLQKKFKNFQNECSRNLKALFACFPEYRDDVASALGLPETDTALFTPGLTFADFENVVQFGDRPNVFQAERGGVKVIVKTFDDSRKFSREVSVMNAVNHQYVIRYIDAFKTTDEAREVSLYCIVMPHHSGEAIDVWLSTHGEKPEVLLRVLKNVAQAIVALHKACVAHCDIKPANIVMSDMAPDGHPILIDFDVSRADTKSSDLRLLALQTNSLGISTLAYCPPERREAIETAAAGAVSISATSGADGPCGFSTEGDIWQFAKVMEEVVGENLDTPAGAALPEDVRASLQELLQQMLDPAPSERPKAHDVQAALHRLWLPLRAPVEMAWELSRECSLCFSAVSRAASVSCSGDEPHCVCVPCVEGMIKAVAGDPALWNIADDGDEWMKCQFPGCDGRFSQDALLHVDGDVAASMTGIIQGRSAQQAVQRHEEERRRVKTDTQRAFEHVAEQIIQLRCPTCNTPCAIDFTMCMALQCHASTSCKWFCAWCLTICASGSEGHTHITDCHHKPQSEKKNMFSNAATWNRHRRGWVRPQLEEYLGTLEGNVAEAVRLHPQFAEYFA